MKRNALSLLFIVVLLVLPGCGPKNTISADALNGVVGPVLDRHDRYVTIDPTLDVTERTTFLRSSALVRAMVEEASTE